MPGELTILAAVIDAGNEPLPPTVGRLIEHAPESFDDGRAGQIAAIVKAMRVRSEPINFAIIGNKHPQFLDFITRELLPAAMGLDTAESQAPECWNAYQVRQAKTILAAAGQSLDDAPKQAPAIIAATRSAFDRLAGDSSGLRERLTARLYSPETKPNEPEPRYFLAGVPICTPANLTTISAQAKAGKTAGIGAMVASTFAIRGSDCLGFTSQNPQGFAVVHFDTEQSPFDHWVAMGRVMRRAGLENMPPWIRSYCLTGFSPDDIRAAIRYLIEQESKQFGGIHSVFLDGAADAVHDVNDPAESGALVTELHGLAIKFNSPVLNIIHLNPGSLEKTRGHLGSQLERKSETNLRLEKDESGLTVIWAHKNRRAPIPKATAPRFAWCDQAGMHTSAETLKVTQDDSDRETLTELAQEVFSQRPSMRRMDLETTVKNTLTVSQKTAERKVSRMVELGIIKKSIAGHYSPAT